MARLAGRASDKKLIWCVDFGTTKAMAALFDCDTSTVTDSRELMANPRKRIHVLREYPGSMPGEMSDQMDSSTAKCPTRYYAEPAGATYKSFQWGFLATSGNDETEGKTLHHGFKTKLGPRKFEAIRNNSLALQALKEEITVFLWLLHCHARDYYAGKPYKSTFVDVKRLEQVVITTPSCFTDEANDLFKSCMIDAMGRAGFVKEDHRIFDGAEGRIMMMPEPEAALSTYLATVDHAATDHPMKRGSPILMFDLGGGTSDVAFVTAMSLDPQILCEDRLKFGTDHGGETIREHWSTAADQALRQAGINDNDTRQEMILLEYDHQFGRAKSYLSFDKDYKFKARHNGNKITIPKEEMSRIRDAVIDPILQVVKAVVDRARTSGVFKREWERTGAPPAIHFLTTGGFSRNSLLRARIESSLQDLAEVHGLVIHFVPHNNWGYEVLYGAICRAAALAGPKPEKWPRSIGIKRSYPRSEPYLSKLPRHIVNNKKLWMPAPDGSRFSKPLVHWFIRKGDPVDNKTFTFKCEHVLENERESPWLAEVLYITEDAVDEYTTLENAQSNGAIEYYEMCCMTTQGLLDDGGHTLHVEESTKGKRRKLKDIPTVRFNFRAHFGDGPLRLSAD